MLSLLSSLEEGDEDDDDDDLQQGKQRNFLNLHSMEGSLQVYKLAVKIGRIHFPRSSLEKEKEILFQSSDFLMYGNKGFGCFMSSSKNFILLELKKLLMFTKVLVQVAVEAFQKHEDKFLEEFILAESFWKRNRAFMPCKTCKTFKVWFNVPDEGTNFLKASVLNSKGEVANGKGYSWNGVHEFLFKLWCYVFEQMEEIFLDKKKDENDALSHVSSAMLQILKPAFDGFQVPSGTRLEEEDCLNPLGYLLENFGSLLKHGELPETEHDIFEQGMLVHYVLCDVGVCFTMCLFTPVGSYSNIQNITSSSQTEVQQQSVRGMEDREKEENSWKCKKNSYGVEEVWQVQTVQAFQAFSILHVVSNFFKAVLRVVKDGHVSFFEKFMLEKLKLDDKQSSHQISSSYKNGNKIVHVLEEGIKEMSPATLPLNVTGNGSGDDVHGGSRADERPKEDPCSKKENALDQWQFELSDFSPTDGQYPEGMGNVDLWTIATREEKVQYAFYISQLPSTFQTFNQGVLEVRQTSHALQMGVTDSSSPQCLGTVTHSKVKATHGPRDKAAHRCLDKSSHAIVQWAMQPTDAFDFQIQNSLHVPNEKSVHVAHGFESQIEKDICHFPTISFLRTKETFSLLTVQGTFGSL